MENQISLTIQSLECMKRWPLIFVIVSCKDVAGFPQLVLQLRDPTTPSSLPLGSFRYGMQGDSQSLGDLSLQHRAK
jgi:hypothetical protein